MSYATQIHQQSVNLFQTDLVSIARLCSWINKCTLCCYTIWYAPPSLCILKLYVREGGKTLVIHLTKTKEDVFIYWYLATAWKPFFMDNFCESDTFLHDLYYKLFGKNLSLWFKVPARLYNTLLATIYLKHFKSVNLTHHFTDKWKKCNSCVT